MIARQKLLDALDLLRQSGVRRMHVTPAFYIGYVRWWAQTILDAPWDLGQNHAIASRLSYRSDDDIVTERSGDSLYYRGMSVRLADEFR